MAGPALAPAGRPAAAISISFPVFRFDVERKPEYLAQLKAAGAEASCALGRWG